MDVQYIADVLDQWSDFSEEESDFSEEESEDSSSDESEKEEETRWAKVAGEECYISTSRWSTVEPHSQLATTRSSSICKVATSPRQGGNVWTA